MRTLATVLAAALVLVAVAGPAAADRTTEDHPFEVPGRWTPFEKGGLTFQAAADASYSPDEARSGSSSIHVGFDGALPDGQDHGAVGLERVVPVEEVDDLAFSYKVTAYEHDAGSSLERLKAGVALEPLDEDGDRLDRAAYWVAAWHGSDDTQTPDHDGVVVESTDPELGTWNDVSADPASETPVDWSEAHGVRVTIFAKATWAANDAFSMYVDDLRVGGPAADDPAPAFRADGVEVSASAQAPSLATPALEPRTVATPAIEAPATCTVEPCQEPTEAATPAAHVDRTCASPAACAGPVDVAEQEVEAPAACQVADPACQEEQRVLDPQEASSPAVDEQEVDPETDADAEARTPTVGVGQPQLMANAAGPVTASPEAPVLGTVEVTLCPFRCPVPAVPDAGVHGATHLEADAGAAGEEVEVEPPALP